MMHSCGDLRASNRGLCGSRLLASQIRDVHTDISHLVETPEARVMIEMSPEINSVRVCYGDCVVDCRRWCEPFSGSLQQSRTLYDDRARTVDEGRRVTVVEEQMRV